MGKTKFSFFIILFLGFLMHAQTFDSNLGPILQNIGARQTMTLDGLWQIIIDPLETGYYDHRLKPRTKKGYFSNAKPKSPSDLIEYDFDTGYQITVPGDWNTQMEKLYYYEGTVWYKRDFNALKKDGNEVYLYFEAVNYEARVYLNGELLGVHIGGYTPFQFKVTDKLKSIGNTLIVKVDNKRKREAIPTVNTDWWNYGGITRSVHLITVPKKHIIDYQIGLKKGSVQEIVGEITFANASDGDMATISIPELKIRKEVRIENNMARFSVKVKPQLWSPDNPKRYEVILNNGEEQLTDSIGFRTIATKDAQILLNGVPIFLKGISIHEEAPFKTGRVTTREECRILLKWAKELGCNFVRLAHYPHSQTMVREAEKLGLIVWSEIPVYWTVLFDNPDTYANAEQQLIEMISRDKNRAAIALWSIANETPEGDSRIRFLSNLAKKVRELDDSRLVTAALDTQSGKGSEKIIADHLGEYVDVIGINTYCGWYSGKPEDCAQLTWKSEYNKPMIISEMGGGALQGLHGGANERWTEEYQEAVYKYNIEMAKNIDFLAGISPWILMDFRSPRRNLRRIQKDFNRKGLVSENGIPKKAYYTLKAYYETID